MRKMYKFGKSFISKNIAKSLAARAQSAPSPAGRVGAYTWRSVLAKRQYKLGVEFLKRRPK
jgi:hypothetical protein